MAKAHLRLVKSTCLNGTVPQCLLVYCNGKREGDWPCNHEGTLPVDRFQADDMLIDIERRCRCTKCGWRRADLRPDYSGPYEPRTSAGWIMAPGGAR